MEMTSSDRHRQGQNLKQPECITSNSRNCNHDSSPSHDPKWKWNATVPSSLCLPIAGMQWNESGNVLCNSDEPMNVVRNASRTGFRSDTRIGLDSQAVDKPPCSS